ncbi:MAG: thiamine phosphate synthase [Actinomycetota bacterium]|nr:thiamine phosphate synthase [Actinomycetota bacterium]
MTLPSLLVLTDAAQCTGALTDTVAAAVRHGARAVVLREKHLPASERSELARALRTELELVGGMLIVAGAADGVAEAYGDGVHLASAEAMPARRPAVVGRSCHCAAEVRRAVHGGCDYVTLSPVFPTPSKPGYGPVLGLDGFDALARSAPPAYALGGVTPAEVPACRSAGAAGVAAMGAVMRDPSTVATFLDALQEVSP